MVLAYPAWFLVAGPGHLVGPIWGNGWIDQYGNTVASFWSAGGSASYAARCSASAATGTRAPGLGYLGAGITVLAVVALVVWRHDRRLQLFGALALVAGVLSLGPGHGYWVPWEAVARVPWVGDIVEVRFTLVLTLYPGGDGGGGDRPGSGRGPRPSGRP